MRLAQENWRESEGMKDARRRTSVQRKSEESDVEGLRRWGVKGGGSRFIYCSRRLAPLFVSASQLQKGDWGSRWREMHQIVMATRTALLVHQEKKAVQDTDASVSCLFG